MVNCDRSSSAAMVILERIANKLPPKYGVPVMCLLLNLPVTLIVSIYILADSDTYIRIVAGVVIFAVLNIVESLLGSWADATDKLPQQAENTIVVEYSEHGNYGLSSKNVILEYLLIGAGITDGRYYLLACGGNKKVEEIIMSANEIEDVKNYTYRRFPGIKWSCMKRC